MSRYIDADEAEKWLRAGCAYAIRELPSIEIVRCKECKHWCCHDDVDYDQTEFVYYCEANKISFKGDGFCSYGEREGE